MDSRTLRPRNRRKTDQPSKFVQQDSEEELLDKASKQDNEVGEMETDAKLKVEPTVALVLDKKTKGLKRKLDEESKGVKRKSSDTESRGVKRKSPDDQGTSEGKTKEKEATSKTTSSAAAAKGSLTDEIIQLSLPPRKQLKRETEGPLLSIEEQKLMHTDVLTLLKRFSPKYYVPLPKIWAIPKSQLTTAQTQKN